MLIPKSISSIEVDATLTEILPSAVVLSFSSVGVAVSAGFTSPTLFQSAGNEGVDAVSPADLFSVVNTNV